MGKIQFKEKEFNENSRFKYKPTGDIVTFLGFSEKPFQKETLGKFKKLSDKTIIECLMTEVEEISELNL